VVVVEGAEVAEGIDVEVVVDGIEVDGAEVDVDVGDGTVVVEGTELDVGGAVVVVVEGDGRVEASVTLRPGGMVVAGDATGRVVDAMLPSALDRLVVASRRVPTGIWAAGVAGRWVVGGVDAPAMPPAPAASGLPAGGRSCGGASRSA